ncbi:MAG: c-type cytochrome domain-containing protein [Verrucomicrobiota bacterium]
MKSNIPNSRSNPHLLLSAAAAGFAGLALAVTTSVRGADAPAAPAAPAAKPAATAPAAPAKAVPFAEIKPLLEKYCYSCHGGTLAPAGTAANATARGGLSLDTMENALKGGRKKAGTAIVPGKAAESELIRRITLDPTDKDIMPQKNKPAPTAAEIKKITDWVNGGASWK